MKRLRIISALWFAALMACSTNKPLTPPQAAPAVKVLVPVPVPCQIEQVAPSSLPSALTAPLTDIYRAVQIVLADREVLKADRTKLAAANSDPCPVK